MTSPSSDPLAELLHTLDLSDLAGARTREDIFVGPSQPRVNHRVYGGQVLAQSIVAAARTVAEDRPIHSMHGYFLRPGDDAESITFGIERLRDGRSFSARRIHAYQKGQVILSAIASFQLPSDGVSHQDPMPGGIPDPEELPSLVEAYGGRADAATQQWLLDRPFDVRHIEEPLYLSAAKERVAHQAVWLKAKGRLPSDQTLHRAALAYASDYVVLEAALRKHGIPWATRGLSVASLDHAMWWHNHVSVDEWLLYVIDSPSASGARGLGYGRFYSQDGTLVATVAQEGMIRVPDHTLFSH